jgi:hypothetical protein
MLYFPCESVFFEGPDCSGKTTLICKLHSITNYRWHLVDRSFISRLLFSQMYKRDTPFVKDFSKKELYNLNNRFIMLFPSWKEIKKRYGKRGDEIHDLSSLRNVYESYHKEYKRIMFLPNVISIVDGTVESNAALIKSRLDYLEKTTLKKVSSQVQKLAEECASKEAAGITFTLYDDCSFDVDDPSVMLTEGEEKYYQTIKTGMIKKIKNEIEGINEYNEKQGMLSRRFIYTNNSCISFIHAMCRDDSLNIDFVLRSSNVKQTFHNDLKFLYHLSKCVYDQLNFDNIKFVKMRFTLNSAHIIR